MRWSQRCLQTYWLTGQSHFYSKCTNPPNLGAYHDDDDADDGDDDDDDYYDYNDDDPCDEADDALSWLTCQSHVYSKRANPNMLEGYASDDHCDEADDAFMNLGSQVNPMSISYILAHTPISCLSQAC